MPSQVTNLGFIHEGPAIQTSTPARCGHISHMDGFVTFGFTKLIEGDLNPFVSNI